MTVYCAIPPLDQAATRIGRGYGLGYNRDRSRRDQLHGGMDFVADRGTPVIAPIPGVVALKSNDTGAGRVRGMGGYGNAVVLEHRFDVPGLPNPFWTSYNHLRDPVTLNVGDRVSTGTLLGYVGNTTNGQFSGMGPHLHFELRIRPFPGSYDRDTRDPALLFGGMGIDLVGARREVERMVGGQLLVRSGGESDCRASGLTPTIAGFTIDGSMAGFDRFFCDHGTRGGGPCPMCGASGHAGSVASLDGLGSAPSGYVDPTVLRTKYSSFGTSRSNQNVESVTPPDYAAMLIANDNTRPRETVSSGGGGVLLIGGAIGAWLLLRRR